MPRIGGAEPRTEKIEPPFGRDAGLRKDEEEVREEGREDVRGEEAEGRDEEKESIESIKRENCLLWSEGSANEDVKGERVRTAAGIVFEMLDTLEKWAEFRDNFPKARINEVIFPLLRLHLQI